MEGFFVVCFCSGGLVNQSSTYTLKTVFRCLLQVCVVCSLPLTLWLFVLPLQLTTSRVTCSAAQPSWPSPASAVWRVMWRLAAVRKTHYSSRALGCFVFCLSLYVQMAFLSSYFVLTDWHSWPWRLQSADSDRQSQFPCLFPLWSSVQRVSPSLVFIL